MQSESHWPAHSWAPPRPDAWLALCLGAALPVRSCLGLHGGQSHAGLLALACWPSSCLGRVWLPGAVGLMALCWAARPTCAESAPPGCVGRQRARHAATSNCLSASTTSAINSTSYQEKKKQTMQLEKLYYKEVSFPIRMHNSSAWRVQENFHI